MNKDELLARWEKSEEILRAAFNLLPPNSVDALRTTKKLFLRFLDHNELELAMEQLEGLGEANKVGNEFWEQMILAAENMALDESVDYYRTKLKK